LFDQLFRAQKGFRQFAEVLRGRYLIPRGGIIDFSGCAQDFAVFGQTFAERARHAGEPALKAAEIVGQGFDILRHRPDLRAEGAGQAVREGRRELRHAVFLTADD
jgi:hypothetical protein